ncbi:CGNR zinc finger domain-containing protein [Streptomyces longispororuber]|uniref:CGNR zinc finger domain-containing protein n=1 Tax=Streptomyces longispororuber TaxID=68230 RepID=UPI00210E6169|nr:CGNR zinc finger domain-containing protein [Streptomyces longispororuber]MCQ4207073.1 CGNR zinc finger domain-containing protein [Streptomyces longispororuber]
MRDISTGPDAARLVLDLALTVRHDGQGGVADDLLAPDGLTGWVREHAAALPLTEGYTGDPGSLERVRALRAAVRALFARAVRPGEPSPADARRLLPVAEALARLNAAAALVPAVPALDWPDDGPAVRELAVTEPGDTDLLVATLARAAVTFLTSEDRTRLRACHAPRCVRYFLKEHPRQEWCKPSCGNRARVARHHERHNSRAGNAT